MLRIIQNSHVSGAKSYYTEALSRDDYYSEGQEIVGHWGGRGAERLGLGGRVTKEAFDSLCENKNPATGRTLTARTKEGRRVGYDFNFHAPKSVSIVYAMTSDGRIRDAFQAAVQATMRELEQDAAARVRKGGADDQRTTGNLLWAEFTHTTARPVGGIPDPHLHSHNFVFNATWDDTERAWKAAQIGDIKRDAPYYEAAFHARFAANLADAGFAIERTTKGWELAGMDRSLNDKFSRRTAEIEALAQRKGVQSAEAKAALGASSRNKKREDLTMPELLDLWEMRLSAEDQKAVEAASKGDVPASAPLSAKGAMDWSLAHSFERSSVVSEKTLMAHALRHGVGSVRPEEIAREVGRQGIITKRLKGERISTTDGVLGEESAMLAWAREGRGTCRALGVGPVEFERDFLNAGQQNAVRHILGSHDRVIAIRGAAGVGKTTLLQEAVRGIEHGGHQVYAFAPSAEASRGVLRSEGFKDAETLARLLHDARLQEEVTGQVILVDEAGLVGTRQMARLFAIAEERGARVILTGDVRQHGSVERGDALRLLETHAGMKVAEVTQIQRQKGGYKAAVEALSRGDVETGLRRLDALGFVQEITDDKERLGRLVADYLKAADEKKTALIVSPTHREGGAVSALIRQGLRARRLLGNEERAFPQLTNSALTEAQRSQAESYQAGDVVVFVQNASGFTRGERATIAGRDEEGALVARRASGSLAPLPLDQAARFQVYEPGSVPIAAGEQIRITRNGQTADKKHRLNNGAIYRVKGFTREGDIRLENGWVIGRSFGHLAHGYVSTSVSSQGKTVDRVLIAQSAMSFGAANREQFYVSASRGRERCTIYTDDKAFLRTAVERSGRRMAATELTSGHAGTARPRETRLRDRAELVRRLGQVAMAYAAQKLGDLRAGISKIHDRMATQRRIDRGAAYER